MFRRFFSGLVRRRPDVPARPPAGPMEIQDALHDSDGIAPGVDRPMVGAFGTIVFTGEFFANPEAGDVRLERDVQILFASKEVFVARDVGFGMLYVIDREKNLSLGCRMTAHFHKRQSPKPAKVYPLVQQ